MSEDIRCEFCGVYLKESERATHEATHAEKRARFEVEGKKYSYLIRDDDGYWLNMPTSRLLSAIADSRHYDSDESLLERLGMCQKELEKAQTKLNRAGQGLAFRQYQINLINGNERP